MKKYAKVINEETGLCEVGVGTNAEFYTSIGMEEIEVEQSEVDGQRYLSEKCPRKTDGERLAEAKALKLAENVSKRDERLRAGVEYRGVLFDSDTDSKVNIMGALSALLDGDSVGWNSMDNETVIMTKVELEELGALLIGLTSTVWGAEGLNVQYINAINACTTLEELEAVVIDYTLV